MRGWAGIVIVVLAFVPGGCSEDPEVAGDQAVAWTLDETLVVTQRVGVLDPEDGVAFGRVTRAKLLPSGFAVLDGQAEELHFFSGSGESVVSARAGRGPQEVYIPLDLTVSAEGVVTLLNEAGTEVMQFNGGEDPPEFHREVRLEGGVGRRFCAFGNALFFHGIRNGWMVHKVDESGAVVDRLAEKPEVDFDVGDGFRDVAESMVLGGPILCLEDQGLVIRAGALDSRVVAYSSSGELVWEVRLEDFRARVPELTLAGGLGATELERGEEHHAVNHLLQWDSATLLVQLRVARFGVESSGDGPLMESRFLSIEDGREIYRTRDLPRIVDVDEGRLLSIREDLYPEVIIYGR